MNRNRKPRSFYGSGLKRFVLASVLSFGALLAGEALSAQQIEMADHDLEIGGRPVEIAFDVDEYTNASGTEIVRSESDFHTIADVPIDALAMVFLNHDRTGEYLPNLHEYEWMPLPGSQGNVVIELQRIGVRFMGIDATYQIRQRSEAIDLRHERPRQFVLEYEMIESLDGKFESSAGTFLLEEMLVAGRPVTYLRQHNVTEFRDPFRGFAGILRAFAPGGTRRLFRAMIDEAERYVEP